MHASSSAIPQPSNSIKTAVRFFVLVSIVILLGLAVHFIITLTQRSFDGQHRFTIAVLKKNTADIISFAPETQSISIVHTRGSSGLLGRDLEIPIDATVSLLQSVSLDNPQDFMKYLSGHIGEVHPIGMNTIDATALLWFAQKIKSDNISIKTVSLPFDPASSLSTLFLDKTLYGEAKTISVVNAAGESGMAGRMTKLVTNMGGNVISVTTAEQSTDTSTIAYFGERSYTVDRLEKTLHFKLIPMAKQTFSDIIITIGTDSIDAKEF